MELTAGIRRRAGRVGQILAFLAALFLAVMPHASHAVSGEGAGHSHIGGHCDALETEKSPSDSQDCTVPSHGDCAHHIYSMARMLSEQSLDHVPATAEALHEAALRQLSLTTEPPPPRTPS